MQLPLSFGAEGMLACADRSLAMLVSESGFGDVLGEENVVLDPSRIAARVDRVSR
jgi:putative Mg2+ transporter-C (MgtC) family protein